MVWGFSRRLLYAAGCGIGIAAFGLVLLVVSSILYQLWIFECFYWTCAPTRAFRAVELTVPDSLFPAGATGNILHPASETLGANESATATTSWEGGRATYTVNRYGRDKVAEDYYERFVALFPNYNETPEELRLETMFADEYIIGCGISEFGGYRCRYAGRYKEFVLTFNASIDNHLTYRDLADIIHFIDVQIGDLISSPP